ncbi:pre-peptidase C-terminal domain-containing protein [Kordiimonas aquimaris]|uniref:pre-peptidase C-terminal domain-containing protein n=1 Tax=Kordiimonas aquimaris TaxID=707591 RepID=UPI0021D1C0B2|nr:pre-peptidase C-terminal domain-containing protein [Kordiimonas aquimaris]
MSYTESYSHTHDHSHGAGHNHSHSHSHNTGCDCADCAEAAAATAPFLPVNQTATTTASEPQNAAATLPDDEPTGSIATQLSVSVGSSVTANIEEENDIDFFAVTLEAGVTYQIDLEGSRTGGGTLLDPFLTGIFNANGARVANSDDDDGVVTNSRIIFTPTQSGTFFIGASSFNNVNLTDTGTYTLFVEEQALSTRPDPIEIRRVSDTGNDFIDDLFFGNAFGDGDGPAIISFSFPGPNATFIAPFNLDDEDGNETDVTEFAIPISANGEAVFRDGLEQVEALANVRFVEVPDEGENFGTLRIFGNTADSGNVVGFAGLPSQAVTAGDIAIFESRTGTGTFANFVILHELGHALGLTHPEPDEGTFPEAFFGAEFTLLVPSFSSAFFPTAVRADLYPTTFSYGDILALRTLYGAPDDEQPEDNVYRFDVNGRYFETIFDNGGTDTIEIFGGNEAVVINLTPDDAFFGGAFIDVGTTVTYRDANNIVVGRRDDTIFLTPETIIENITVAGGNDTVVGNAADNRLLGGAGNDSLDGGDGDDFLRGDAGNDAISGGAGNDNSFAGPDDLGNDTVQGNAGNDRLGVGAGNDFAVGGDIASGLNPNTADGAGSDTLFGGAGNDFLVGGSYDSQSETAISTASGENVIFAGTGSDTLFGDGRGDILGGGQGDDEINGGDGDDTIFGGIGSATDNADTIDGGNGDDEIFAATDEDFVSGGAGNDLIFGGDADDTLFGNEGNDTIFGGRDDDEITGGSGSDQFAFAANHGNDTITDFNLSDSLAFEAELNIGSTSDLQATSNNATINGQSGLLITTNTNSSIFLVGITENDISDISLVFI